MQCKEVECIIPSFLKGEENEMVASVQSHLEICKSCREMADTSASLTKELAKLNAIVPQGDFLSKIHKKIEKGNISEKSSGETTTRLQVVSKSSRHSTSSRYNLNKVNLTFFEKLKSYFVLSNFKTPAFTYAVAIHLLVLGLGVFFYMDRVNSGSSKSNARDAFALRSMAYNSAINQSVVMGKISIGVLANDGEVYITQTVRCIQIQLTKPSKGTFITANIKNGELELEQTIIDRYFPDHEVSVLVFKSGVEVWSKGDLEDYMREQFTIKPA